MPHHLALMCYNSVQGVTTVELIIIVVSFIVSYIVMRCLIVSANSLRRIANEAEQIRAALHTISDVEAARGNNELASIQLANGAENSVRLRTMPGLSKPTIKA